MIQLSILKIMEYGPWTMTLGSDREHQLQMLQASLYKQLQDMFSKKNCLVFLNRHDEFFVISNGLGLDEHIQIQKHLEKSFDINLNVSIGHADSPFDANMMAHEELKNNTILSKQHNIFGSINSMMPSTVSIMHLDVDCLTSKKKTLSPYEISISIFALYNKMSSYFLAKNSLTFFMGGDNFVVVASKEAQQSVEEFINITRKESGISLNCGIGNAANARDAMKLATKSLDTIREIRDSGGQKPDVYELSCC